MAIFVTTPTSSAPAAPALEAIDPATTASVPGFTKELAAAMQPAGLVNETPNKTGLDKSEVTDQSPSDLQILPAEVLINAVGDANFALGGQAGSAMRASANPQNTSSSSELTQEQAQDLNALELNALQAAELAAANLAAQMATVSAAPPTPTIPTAPIGQTVQALDASATTGLAQSKDNLGTVGNQSDNFIQGQVPSTTAGATSTENQAATPAIEGSSPAKLEASKPSDSVSSTATSLPRPGDSSQASLADSTQISTLPHAPAEIGRKGNNDQKVAVANASLKVEASSHASESVAANGTALTSSPGPAIALIPGQGTSVGLTTSTPAANSTTLAQSVQAGSSIEPKPTAVLDSKVKSERSVAQESAFNFDAKISSGATARALSPNSLQANTALDGVAPSGLVQAIASREATLEPTADASLPAQTEFQATATQSLEDLSSTFVSSLVGGPQRPVTTVMDWISLQAQERPAPVVPHEVRLDAGAIQLEIQKMVKQGGGHVVMELTPPDQSKFTIELKLDEQGGALLIVEGISDSTRTRLEQSAPQLREQFQQMGLELQLDMRQQGHSGSSGAAQFSNSHERESSARDTANQGGKDTPKMMTQREAGATRAREAGSNQVYLYA